MLKPERIINSSAPIRICDIGGWTDTWFAEYGNIVNIAVRPFVNVQLFVYSRFDVEHRITLFAENYNERFAVDCDQLLLDGKYALLEAAFSVMQVPEDVAIEVHVYSEVPPGASTGTSAAVSIALIAALDMLTPGRMSPAEVAQMAHRIETEILGWQCGIQDQLCSAFGGINYIQMTDYPHASVSPLVLPLPLRLELERRLMLIYLGSAHVSSSVHKQVISGFEQSGKDDPRLIGLRREAMRAKDALLEGNLELYAEVMNANTAWQERMHPDILGEQAKALIAIARETNVCGWKLNGAGGNGGSVTLLFGEMNHDKRRFKEALRAALPEAQVIPISLSPSGVHVWESVPIGHAAAVGQRASTAYAGGILS